MRLLALLFEVVILVAAMVTSARAAESGLTIYNQNFAVVRQTVPLNLKAGSNQIEVNDTTVHLEPDSVILRDPSGKVSFQVLEQNFRADPISEGLLLSIFEGQQIDFRIQEGDQVRIVSGKIIRSGYVPHQAGLARYGPQYAAMQSAYAYGAGGQQPIIEIEGRLRFGLPGTPLFPSLGKDSVLKPSLIWQIDSPQAASLAAELSYVTGGMSWEADYNIVAPEKGDKLDLVGWVTMDNQSGKTFEQAQIKLMAGGVSKVQPASRDEMSMRGALTSMAGVSAGPPVTERTFDEYHLYTLERPTTLHDRETKQVEFVRAAAIDSKIIYVYDGAWIDPNQYRGYSYENIRENSNYGTQSNPKVAVMREFVNSKENNLGMPLPKGRMRFYRRDQQVFEFTGENVIDHTPANETVRVYTGNAFDLTGERRRTSFNVNSNERWVDESFELKVRNHKKEAVQVRALERLYRWNNWEIREKSHEYRKLDSEKIEFPIDIPPDGEVTVKYQVHYSW